MSKAADSLTTSRRALLASGSAILFASAAGAATAQPCDGALIRAAEEYIRLEDEYEIACEGEDTLPEPERSACEARLNAIFDRQNALFAQLCDMRPTTPEEWRAKAKAVRCSLGHFSEATKPARQENWLAWSLADDLLQAGAV